MHRKKTKLEEGLEAELKQMWLKPLSRLPVYKDLPRLVDRIDIECRAGQITEPQLLLSSNSRGSVLMLADEKDGPTLVDSSLFDRVCGILLQLAADLDPELLGSMRHKISELATAGASIETAMPELFDALGANSKRRDAPSCCKGHTLMLQRSPHEP